MMQTAYICDNCRKAIGPLPYGPLFVRVRSNSEPQVNSDCEFCNFACAGEWLARDGHKGHPVSSRTSDGQSVNGERKTL